MPEFKVGDRVRTKLDGSTGVVDKIENEQVWVDSGDRGYWWERESEIELISVIGDSPFEQSVRRHTDRIAKLLIAKNKAYGDAALNPVRIFSSASRIEQLNVRIDDKISRIQRGTDYGDEDTVRDLIGYLVLRLIAEESE